MLPYVDAIERAVREKGGSVFLLGLARKLGQIPGYTASRGKMGHAEVLRLFPRKFKLEKDGHARAGLRVSLP